MCPSSLACRVMHYEEPKLERLLTPNQVRSLLGLSKQRSLFTLGIPHIEIGGRRRYDPADIRSWMAMYRVDPDRVRETLRPWPVRRRMRAKATEPVTSANITKPSRGFTLEQERAYLRRKEEREALGLPIFGRLPKGALAEARARAAAKAASKG